MYGRVSFTMDEIYEKDGIFLRPMTDEDTDLIVRWRNSDAVRTNFIYRELFTPQSHRQWIETMVKTGRVVQMVICEKAAPSGEDAEERPGQGTSGQGTPMQGTPVGSVYIRDIDRTHHKGEYGIFIGEDSARGRGIGTAAAKLMIRYAFESLGLHKLFLRVLADNARAIGSYEKAGFKQEAYLKDDVCIDGVYRDVALMAVINEK